MKIWPLVNIPSWLSKCLLVLGGAALFLSPLLADSVAPDANPAEFATGAQDSLADKSAIDFLDGLRSFGNGMFKAPALLLAQNSEAEGAYIVPLPPSAESPSPVSDQIPSPVMDNLEPRPIVSPGSAGRQPWGDLFTSGLYYTIDFSYLAVEALGESIWTTLKVGRGPSMMNPCWTGPIRAPRRIAAWIRNRQL
jgi:hypothetical protein